MAVESQVPKIVAVCVLLTVISTLVVILRFLSRHISKIGYGWDDWLSLIALPFVLATNIVLLVNTNNGFGYHAADGPPDSLLYFEITIYVIEILYSIALGLVKIAVLLFYNRIFRNTSQKFTIISWIIGVITVIWTLGIVFSAAFQCTPVAAAWEPNTSGNCIDLGAFFLGQSVTDVLLDFAILLLPVPALWRLQIANVQKVGLIFVFILGYIVPIISVVRIVSIAQVLGVVDTVSSDGTSTEDLDLTWDYCDVALWTTAEASLGLISICVPALYHLFKMAARRSGLLGSSGALNSSRLSRSKSQPRGRRMSRNSFSALASGTNDFQDLDHESREREDFPLSERDQIRQT